jgi:hypothetical protein
MAEHQRNYNFVQAKWLQLMQVHPVMYPYFIFLLLLLPTSPFDKTVMSRLEKDETAVSSNMC